MKINLRRGRTAAKFHAGFFVPSMVAVFLVVIFFVLLFGTRLLNKSQPVEVGYSERYRELSGKESLSAEEQAELELETCRYKRDLVRYLKNKAMANYDREKANYRQSCEKILPLDI